nr:uncharacterized protein LOC109169836 [Ipomoea batatas]
MERRLIKLCSELNGVVSGALGFNQSSVLRIVGCPGFVFGAGMGLAVPVVILELLPENKDMTIWIILMLFFLIQLRKLYLLITGLIDIPVTMDFSGAFEIEEPPPDSEDTEMISTTPSFEIEERSSTSDLEISPDGLVPARQNEIEEISSTSSDLETARQDEIEEISNTFDIEIFPDGLVPASQDEVGHPPIAANSESLTESTFAGLIVGNAPSGRFTGAKATMTIWNPILRGDYQYSSSSLYVEDEDNQIVVGWTSDNYAKTGCYINHCPGFVITSNVIPVDYPFPNMSVFEGQQFDVTLEVVKGSNGDWELNFNDQTLGTWPSSIFSKMSESASRLRFGGECFKPEGQSQSPQMGSGRFKFKQYDKTCYMRRVSYSDPVYGSAVLDESMVQTQLSRCYFAESIGYNFHDDWYQYSFMFGGAGGRDGERCLGN